MLVCVRRLLALPLKRLVNAPLSLNHAETLGLTLTPSLLDAATEVGSEAVDTACCVAQSGPELARLTLLKVEELAPTEHLQQRLAPRTRAVLLLCRAHVPTNVAPGEQQGREGKNTEKARRDGALPKGGYSDANGNVNRNGTACHTYIMHRRCNTATMLRHRLQPGDVLWRASDVAEDWLLGVPPLIAPAAAAAAAAAVSGASGSASATFLPNYRRLLLFYGESD